MKTMYKYIVLILGVLSFSSCLGDLDTAPTDGSMLIDELVYQDKANYKGVFAKCYAVLALTGQKGSDGTPDLQNVDEGYSSFVRSMFYLQHMTSDEAHSTSTSNGMRQMLTTSWDSQVGIISGAYFRVYIAISTCNEFLRQTTREKLEERGQAGDAAFVAEIEGYRNEARFIRAYCYSVVCDAWGSGPFVTDEDPIGGGILPEQASRTEIFQYVENELKDLENKLVGPKTNEYGRVDQVAAWFLLARLYLNAEVYTGTARWTESLSYAEKVINSGYTLAPRYIYNFLADNHTSPEIIWSLNFDGVYSKTSGGTTFLTCSQIGGDMQNYIDFGVTNVWGNIRLGADFSDRFSEEDLYFDISERNFDMKENNYKRDKRSLIYTHGHTKEIPTVDPAPDFGLGYMSTKWRNITKDMEDGSDPASVDIDFPVFRLAEAYLMAAEAILRTNGSRTTALAYLNEVRDRAYETGAYGNAVRSPLTDSEMSLDYIIEERSRELWFELTRRTDLIRFDMFTGGKYNWAWKGGVPEGQAVDDKYKLFPIPNMDLTSNPNLVQNPGY